MKRILIASILLFLIGSIAYCEEVRFKQKAELFIVNGKVFNSRPHAYVTLDIQKDKVLYKTIEDWDRKTVEHPGGVFQIVSEGKGIITSSEPEWIQKIKDLIQKEDLRSEHIIRAVYWGGNSVNLLIIGETFLLEVKNSVFFGNATNYMYYERVK